MAVLARLPVGSLPSCVQTLSELARVTVLDAQLYQAAKERYNEVKKW